MRVIVFFLLILSVFRVVVSASASDSPSVRSIKASACLLIIDQDRWFKESETIDVKEFGVVCSLYLTQLQKNLCSDNRSHHCEEIKRALGLLDRIATQIVDYHKKHTPCPELFTECFFPIFQEVAEYLFEKREESVEGELFRQLLLVYKKIGTKGYVDKHSALFNMFWGELFDGLSVMLVKYCFMHESDDGLSSGSDSERSDDCGALDRSLEGHKDFRTGDAESIIGSAVSAPISISSGFSGGSPARPR